jgi:hypothetical protein
MRSFRGETTSHFFVVSDGKSERAPHHRTASSLKNKMRAAQHRTSKMEFTGFLRRRRRFDLGTFIPVSRHGTRHLLDAGRFLAGSEYLSSSVDRFPVMGSVATIRPCPSKRHYTRHLHIVCSRRFVPRRLDRGMISSASDAPAPRAPATGRSIT